MMRSSLALGVAILIVALIAVSTAAAWLPRTWYRSLLYGGGKPNRFSRRINSAWARLFSRGILPQFLVMLETRGRRSGRVQRIPLVVAEMGGKRYLVSMLGEGDWVRNVRASGDTAVLRHGMVETVSLEEVPVAERAPILKAYLARANGARPHFDLDWNAPLSEFERIAARYPVFVITKSSVQA